MNIKTWKLGDNTYSIWHGLGGRRLQQYDAARGLWRDVVWNKEDALALAKAATAAAEFLPSNKLAK